VSKVPPLNAAVVPALARSASTDWEPERKTTRREERGKRGAVRKNRSMLIAVGPGKNG
jgi:hypothetical protein